MDRKRGRKGRENIKWAFEKYIRVKEVFLLFYFLAVKGRREKITKKTCHMVEFSSIVFHISARANFTPLLSREENETKKSFAVMKSSIFRMEISRESEMERKGLSPWKWCSAGSEMFINTRNWIDFDANNSSESNESISLRMMKAWKFLLCKVWRWRSADWIAERMLDALSHFVTLRLYSGSLCDELNRNETPRLTQ